ncbi:type 2 lanthipeptide synthetase LanM family protein [Kitasatospora paranensis]|uniref:Type 2 lanthipeptide synthetase LanM family protein n=1 Tax=Kitasatospora paranensis TaxID=258053 RepID=A0ABW2FQS2_9ACTN
MPDTSELRRSAARAVPLAHRGRAAAPQAPDPEADDRARRRAARWQAQRPFDAPGWFDRRLAADGLDPAELALLLGESPTALAARLGPQGWADRLADAFDRAPAPAAAPPDGDEHPFAVLAAPLIAAARDRLTTALTALGPTPLGSPADLTAMLLPALTGTAHAMAVRTLIVELHVARLTGRLTGATPEDRYRDFLRLLAEPAEAIRILAEHPVLARRLTTAADQWADTGRTLLHRLAADLPAVARTFAAGADPGPLTAIRTGLGDAHRGGATVAGLTFADGTRIVYKPRPLDVDVHFQALVRRLNPQLRLPLLDVPLLARDGYGWMAHVTARPCRDATELHAFYHRAGTLAALLHLTDAVDCHAQNLLAVGDQPVLVDLEALLHPDLHEPAKDLSHAERLARHDAAHSVLRSGLLPQRMWDEDGNGGTDLSALGWDPSRLPPRPAPEVVGLGTDEIRIEYRPAPVEAPGNRPLPPDRPLCLADHADAVDAGFTEAYRLLAADREQVDLLLTAFARDETRLLRRDTLEYRSLLATACHPDLLRDALDQDRHLDRLWALAAWEDSVGGFVAHEHADLWNNDVPVFTIRPDGVHARSSTGAVIPDVTDRPALDVAREKLAAFGEDDLARQRRLLRLSLTTADGAAEPRRTPTTAEPRTPATAEPRATPVPDPGPPRDPDGSALRSRALAKAAEAADDLLREAYRGPDDLAWTGPNWAPPGRWAPAELGPDLYSGTAGIVLFLDRLARVTGDTGHRRSADAATATLRRQIRRRTDRLGGGITGTGGLLYTLAQLTADRPDPELDTLAEALVARAAATAADDTWYDVIAGSAGTIGGLAAWAAVRPGAAVTDALARCARHLADRARPHPEGGVGWLPQPLAATVDRPLAGFAHGCSGIAWALVTAARLLGDDRLPDLARAAFAHERTLYDPAAGNWRDVREDPAVREHPVLWCHGAAGAALARAETADLLDDPELRAERAAALTTVAQSGFGLNSSLCHGDLGNIDVLRLSGAPYVGAAAAALDTLDRDGWACGLPHGVRSPSLMVGVAGIGHGLLRLASPEAVPSVLALRPPQTG